MYREVRLAGSTPEVWTENFVSRFYFPVALTNLRMRLDMRWAAIAKRLRPGQSLLDAGCGMGQWVLFLNRNGFETSGLDYSNEMIDLMASKHPEIRWLRGPVQAIPLPDASLDAVISWGVIEHDEKGPGPALKEFWRVLKPGGHAFLTVPFDTPHHRASSQVQFPQRDDAVFFQYFFTPDDFSTALSAVGFQVEVIKECGGHYAVLFPKLYRRVATWPSVLQYAVTYLLAPLVLASSHSRNMLLAVVRK